MPPARDSTKGQAAPGCRSPLGPHSLPPALALAVLLIASVARSVIWRPGVPAVLPCVLASSGAAAAVTAAAHASIALQASHSSRCPAVGLRPLDLVYNLTVDLAVPVFHEDVTWTRAFPHWTTVLLSRDNATNPENVLPNLAFESLPVVRYIIRHYDCLPDRVLFVHAGNPSPHFLGALDPTDRAPGRRVDMVPALRALKLSLPRPYVSISLHGRPSINGFNPLTGEFTRFWREMHFVHVASGLEEFLGPLPFNVTAECFAQFLVTREAIRSKPLAMWLRLDQWLSSGTYCWTERASDSLSRTLLGPACECLPEKQVAIALEFMWSFIFSGIAEERIITDACEIYDCARFDAPRRKIPPPP